MSKFKGRYPNRKTRNTIEGFLIIAVIAVVALINFHARFEEAGERAEEAAYLGDYLSVHYIDVGQGDASLIISPSGECMLIDAGPAASSDYLLKYLRDYNASHLKYLIITHPHEDHYGGAADIIKNIEIDNLVILGDFEDVYPYDRFIYMTAHSRLSPDANILKVKVGDGFSLSDGAHFAIVSPSAVDFDDYNESSLAIRLVYGDTSFLFTGDAEKDAEKDMIWSGYDIKSDVYKAGHHGSSTSSTEIFLCEVDPKIAVISCGKDNPYGHPHKSVLKSFKELGIEYYRTDEDGDVVIISDGVTVKKAA